MSLLALAMNSGTAIEVVPNIDGNIVNYVDGKISLPTGGVYDLTVAYTTPIMFKIWGAGGGSSQSANSGGRGGYTEGLIWLQAGTTYKVVVGGPGQTGYGYTGATANGVAGGSPGGGGLCGRSANGTAWRGSGGGYSGVFVGTETHANSLLIAGGGGGGAEAGGNGGGTTGGTGPNSGNGAAGGGGTQTEGGTAPCNLLGCSTYQSGNTAGSELTGGKGATTFTTFYTGGGGGGGYYGGGGGSGNNYAGGPGGGGSGYIHPTLVTHGQFQQVAAYGGDVPNSSDADYISPAGTQAAGTTQGTFAGSGLVVVKDGSLIHNITPSGDLLESSTRSFTASTLSPTVSWSSPNLYGGITLTTAGVITIPSNIISGTITITATNFRGQTFSKDFFVGAYLKYVQCLYSDTTTQRNRFYVSSVIPDGANYECVWGGVARPTNWGYLVLGLTSFNQADFYPVGIQGQYVINSSRSYGLGNAVAHGVDFCNYPAFGNPIARAYNGYTYQTYANSNIYLGFRMSRSGNTVTLQNFNPSTNTTIYTRTYNVSSYPSIKFVFVTANDSATTSPYQVNLISSNWPSGFFIQQYY